MTCDDKGDPTQTTACARKAIEAGAVADVGSFSFNGGVMVPIYDKAKTAVFGNCCDIAPIEFTSPNTFQMGNNPALNAGGIARAAQDGCKSIGVLELDLPGVTDALNILFTNVAKAYGYTGKLKFVKVPLTTQDYTSQVAQITASVRENFSRDKEIHKLSRLWIRCGTFGSGYFNSREVLPLSQIFRDGCSS